MNPSSWFGTGGDNTLEVLWEDGERVFCRRWLDGADGDRHAVLAVLPAAEYATPASLSRLTHEYGLREDLDSAWAVWPLELVRERVMLTLQSTGGEPLTGSLLRRCLAEWEARGDIDEFPPGEHDTETDRYVPYGDRRDCTMGTLKYSLEQ